MAIPLMLTCPGSLNAQAKQTEKQLFDVHLNEGTLERNIRALAYRYQVPIGLLELPPSPAVSPGILQFKQATAREVLDQLLKDSAYRWQESHGVINIGPQRSDQLMDTIIEHFQVTNALEDTALRELIHKREFQAGLAGAELKIPPRSIAGQVPDVYLRHISLSLRRTTVRDILNRALITLRGHCWYFQRSGDQLQYATIDIF